MTWQEQRVCTSHSPLRKVWVRGPHTTSSGKRLRVMVRCVGGNWVVRAYNVRSPCDCYVMVRRQYLQALLTYGVLTRWPVVSTCKCVERESVSAAVGCWSVRTPCVVSVVFWQWAEEVPTKHGQRTDDVLITCAARRTIDNRIFKTKTRRGSGRTGHAS